MSFSNQELQQLKSLLSSGITALEKKSAEQKRVIDDLVRQKQPFKQAGTKSVVDKLNELIRYHYKGRDKVTAKLAKVRALQSAVKRESTRAVEPERKLFYINFDSPIAGVAGSGGGNSGGVQWCATYDDLSTQQIAGYAQVVPEVPVPAVEQTLTSTVTFPESWSDFKIEQPAFRTLELREEDVQGHRGYVRMVPQDPDPSYMQDRGTGLRQDGFLPSYEKDISSKPSNPKDLIGSGKLPLHLWPNTATAMGCIGFLNGMLKYGRSNFRVLGIRASIYIDAAKRHLDAWFEGEEFDQDDGVPHLAAALACIAIIVDAEAAGVLNDDRAVKGGYRALVARLTPLVAHLKALHKDKNPHHYTIADNRD